MAVTIQTRRDDATDWSTANPVLALGEIGIETDTDKAKFGDGFTAWNDLPYWIDEGAQIPDGTVQGQTLRYNLTDDGWQATSDLIIDDSGNVGIGTDTPVTKLDIAGVVKGDYYEFGTKQSLLYQVSDNSVGFRLGSDVTSFRYPSFIAQADSSVLLTQISSAFALGANNTEHMRIDSAGNVGIGTTSPTAPLSVDRNAITAADPVVSIRAANAGFNSVSQGIQLYESSISGAASINFLTGASTAQGGLTFDVSSGEAMRLDTSGNLLVGTTALPSAANHGFAVVKNGGVGFFNTNSTDGTGATAHYQFINDNGVVGQITTTGSSTTYGTTSDERLKKNITDAGDPFAMINAIQVRSFDWKADDTHQDFGFIAQELVNVAPEAVSIGLTEGDTWGVDPSKLVPVLVKAIQELTARVEALENG